ncbi:hypothetical protein AAG570_012016 [Ranatra chinensis]|uniref:Uncharacterized protein n=1 Tax=Ranatra chinensis TaxID=642074 RepID=A0ABD0YHK5_9HEMI
MASKGRDMFHENKKQETTENGPGKIYADINIKSLLTTKRVTKHPVCMTVYGVKPPCLDNQYYHDQLDDYLIPDDHHHNHNHHIQPTAVPSPTLVQETRILGQVEDSEGSFNGHRDQRYLVSHPAPPPPKQGILEVAQDNGKVGSARIIQGFLGTVTESATRTLWVTKVEKYMDYRVTATLVAKNCVPAPNPVLPFCNAQTPVYLSSETFSHLHDHEKS